ncbi:MAG: acyl-CoA dehydrogenase family protein [Proteobacteria bacterium]|nr:acyl-CoA dehydrogenase family protein [Pseudomonadota bacterium]
MEDLLLLDEHFSVEEKLIRDSVRRFVDDKVLPNIASHYEKGEFPLALIKEVAKLGVLGMALPQSVGGLGASQVAYGLVCQELERGDSGLRSFVSVQSSLCMTPIFAYGSEAQKKRFLPQMAQGNCIGCFGLTEPDSGSDPASLKTKATKVNGGWRLNGAKMWITNATIADIAIIWAKDDADNVRGFIVEKDFQGFKTNEIKHKLSLRASITGEIVLEDCFVPEDNLLPGTHIGLVAALSCLTKARYGIAWGALGAAMACYDIALSYAKERIQFGKPIASFQLIQADLVNMFTEITKTQSFNLHVGRLMDDDKADYVLVSMAKMNACKEALKIARMARNILGANGISLEYHVIRHMNNLESVFTYEGTDNMHHLIIGRHITGLNAFA